MHQAPEDILMNRHAVARVVFFVLVETAALATAFILVVS
jgi:hypothetical protein